jgi:hypothetical protein
MISISKVPNNPGAVVNIGNGRCEDGKELPLQIHALSCLDAADADASCVNKVISFGKISGARKHQCMCDAVVPCNVTGTDDDFDGWNRFARRGHFWIRFFFQIL